jgi:hypothetical protein
LLEPVEGALDDDGLVEDAVPGPGGGPTGAQAFVGVFQES